MLPWNSRRAASIPGMRAQTPSELCVEHLHPPHSSAAVWEPCHNPHHDQEAAQHHWHPQELGTLSFKENLTTLSLTLTMLVLTQKGHKPPQWFSGRESLRLEKSSEPMKSNHSLSAAEVTTGHDPSATSTWLLYPCRDGVSTFSRVCQCLTTLQGKDLPKIQPKLPLGQLEAVPSCPTTVIWEQSPTPTWLHPLVRDLSPLPAHVQLPMTTLELRTSSKQSSVCHCPKTSSLNLPQTLASGRFLPSNLAESGF